MATWVVGDIHGCAVELAQLVDELALGDGDHLLSVGDLFHRGPDPAGVMDVLRSAKATFVLGNHENAVLERFRLAPRSATPGDWPDLREEFPALDDEDLAGDGGRACIVDPGRREEVVRFLQEHQGYFVEHGAIPGGGVTRDGRPWCVVHAGLVPGRHPRDCRPGELMRVRRLQGRGRPFWYEVYTGPNLVLFGHTPSRIPRAHRHGGRLVALGLDTGCLWGSALTAARIDCSEPVIYSIDCKAKRKIK